MLIIYVKPSVRFFSSAWVSIPALFLPLVLLCVKRHTTSHAQWRCCKKTSNSKGRDQSVRVQRPLHAPIFAKIAQDLSPDTLAEVAEMVLETGVGGLL